MSFLNRSVASIAGALTLAFAASVNAHVPPEGSEQHNLLKPYEGFIMHMKNRDGGSCCNKQDGRGDLEERITKDGKYQVKLTHDLEGNPLQGGPKWVDVPEDKILTTQHAEAVCKPQRDADPKSTCKMPPFNVIWYSNTGHIYCYFPRPEIM